MQGLEFKVTEALKCYYGIIMYPSLYLSPDSHALSIHKQLTLRSIIILAYTLAICNVILDDSYLFWCL